MKKLVGVDELATLLGVSVCWIYRKTCQRGPGAIPRLKVGRFLRFDPDAVMDWLRRQQG